MYGEDFSMIKGKKLTIFGIAVLAAVLAVFYQLYTDSVNEDFKNISRTETYRMADHYTGQYHRPGCPKLQQAYGGGKRFESASAAEQEGYSACKRCDAAGPDEPEK